MESFLITSDSPGTCLWSCLATIVPAELELLGPETRAAGPAVKLWQLTLLLHLELPSCCCWPDSARDPSEDDLTGDLRLLEPGLASVSVGLTVSGLDLITLVLGGC